MMIDVNRAALHDGGKTGSASKITAKFRLADQSGVPFLRLLINELNTLVQADGSIAGGDQTAWAAVNTFINVDANLDKVVKKFG